VRRDAAQAGNHAFQPAIPHWKACFLEHFVIENIYSDEMLRRWRRRALPAVKRQSQTQNAIGFHQADFLFPL
jgi:hypothetical protein